MGSSPSQMQRGWWEWLILGGQAQNQPQPDTITVRSPFNTAGTGTPVPAGRDVPPEQSAAPATLPLVGQAAESPGSHCSKAGVKGSHDKPHS